MASSGESGLEAHAAKIRDARECLGWTRQQLAVKCGLTLHAVTRLELADGRPNLRALAHISSTLTAAGVTFTSGDEPDAKLRKPDP